MAQHASTVARLYNSVIEDVITSCKGIFEEEGIDFELLDQMRESWKKKLESAKVVPDAKELAALPPPVITTNAKGKGSKAKVNRTESPTIPQPTLPQIPPASIPVSLQATQQQQLQAHIQPPFTLSHQHQQHFSIQHQPHHIVNQPGALVMNASLQPNSVAAAMMNSGSLPPSGHHFSHGKFLNQLDGDFNSSSSDSSEDDDDEEDDDEEGDHEAENREPEEEVREEQENSPLNSEDDVTDDDDPNELFDTDNVVVCQYDKITRSRNKWKFHLKDGIMNLKGKDYVFQKMLGDAEW